MSSLPLQSADFVPQVVDLLLSEGRRLRASDIHLTPTASAFVMRWRIDGVLQTVAQFDAQFGPRIVARLKVLAGLLTYRTDLPQEGRIARPEEQPQPTAEETRITTFPTLYGEKAAVRLFSSDSVYEYPDQLGLPQDIELSLTDLLRQTSGVVLLTGPSGSGKTTTIYACLREIMRQFGETRSIMTLEDPIESSVSGVTQSQVRPAAGFDLTTGLKSMMRQDPDVIMVGEIRDPETAECVFQASLTGHLVLTTFHAGSSAEAITRLLDMGIEPYLIRSSLKAVICQRLLRRVCPNCSPAAPEQQQQKKLPQSLDKSDTPADQTVCSRCGNTGYYGRFVTAEILKPEVADPEGTLLTQANARQLHTIAEQRGMQSLSMRARQAVSDGLTTNEEVFRVLGRQD
jgi:type II secretory ATPase GspE/PulE/Tfp pilus assembly ATPase PilB-like protein